MLIYLNDLSFKNILPPLRLLNEEEQKKLFESLEIINFSYKPKKVA